MLLTYGSFAHLFYFFLAYVITFALFFIFRKKSESAKRKLVLIIMVINIIQHVFQSFIYPQHFGEGFNVMNTAYNMCSLLMMISPLAIFTKQKHLRDFVFYIGTAAGTVALALPYWIIGEPAFTWAAFRTFFCHALLLASSLLPLLFGFHKCSYRRAPLFGLYYFLAMGVIILNNALCHLGGIYLGTEGMNLVDALYFSNPTWSFGPPEQFRALLDPIARFFAPDCFIFTESGRYVPLLWYFIPVYLGATVFAFVLFAFLDSKRFKSDFEILKSKLNKKTS